MVHVGSEVDVRYPPDLYRLVHRGNPGDIERYLQRLGEACDVLELGVGDGRVAIELAGAGYNITGLELDPAFLKLAEERADGKGVAVRWLSADMMQFELAEHFDAVIAPYNTLYCARDLGACFRCVAKHLKPGGRFVFDVYDVEDFHELMHDDEDVFETVASFELSGERVDVAERADWDREGQRLVVHYRYRFAPSTRAPGREAERRREQIHTITHYYRTQAQLRDMLWDAGFEVDSVEPLSAALDEEEAGSSVFITATRSPDAL